MSHASKMVYLRRIHRRYRQSSRSDKRRILDEFCQVTRYHHKYALRLLNSPRHRISPAGATDAPITDLRPSPRA